MSSRAEKRRFLRVMGKLEGRLKKTHFRCLYPGCTRNAILSHSQQKEGQLRAIAVEGCVYAMDHGFYSAAKRPSDHEYKSIFYGVCRIHS